MPTTLTCRTCGDVYDLPDHLDHAPCRSCGAEICRPKAQGEEIQVLRRATEQRLACEFSEAEASYQQALRLHRDEHEAYWGLALCRYEVEYVRDSRMGGMRPIVHGVHRRPLRSNPAFLRACECAPEEIRIQYQQDATYIDDAMVRIRELASTMPPYDVFLCHKTKDPRGGYTEDFRRATELSRELENRGYNVFFAPEDMQNVAAGANYEAGIYHALTTAKIMLVICSDLEYLMSTWVRSEWKRYLDRVDEADGVYLVPLLYGDMTPGMLPTEMKIRKLQAISMSAFNAKEALLEAVCRAAGTPHAKAQQNGRMAEKAPPVPAAEKATAPVQAVHPVQPVQTPAPVAQPAVAPVVQPAPQKKGSSGPVMVVLIVLLAMLAGGFYVWQQRGGWQPGGNGGVAVSAEQQAIPVAVGLKATAYGAGVQLDWQLDPASGVHYDVYRKENGGKETHLNTSAPVREGSYWDGTAEPGKQYTYRIVATRGNESWAQDIATVQMQATASPVPTPTCTPTPHALDLKAIPSENAVTLSWTGASLGGVTYKVQRASGSGWTTLHSGTTSTVYTDAGLSAGADYHYRITAYLNGEQWTQAECWVTTKATPTPAPTPKAMNLRVTSVGSSSIVISWNYDSNGGVTYRVQRSISGGSWATLTSSTSNTSYTDQNLSSGKTYSYRVTAYRNGSYWTEGTCSATTSTTPKPTTNNTARDVSPYLPYIPPGGISQNCGYERSIMWVQQCLRSLDYGKLAVDGNWGNQTSTAVRQFKKDYGYSTNDLTLTRAMIEHMARLYGQKMNWNFSVLEDYYE